ncbi:hypothetical protein [Lysobacter enzymogenes]
MGPEGPPTRAKRRA